MKKIVCMLLAVLSCCMFCAAASAESQPEGGVNAEQTTTAASDAETTATAPRKPAAETFTGTVKISYDTAPVNTGVTVTVAVEGDTLKEGDVIRWRSFDPAVSMSDADVALSWIDYTGPVVIPANTSMEAAVFFGDGSRSAASSVQISNIDQIPPVPPQIQPSTTGWTKDSLTVTLSGGSDAQSGLLRTEYRIGAEGTWAEYTDSFSLSSASTVYARSVDMAGNVSDAAVLDVGNFDLTPPDVTALSVSLSAEGNPVVADSGAFSKYYGAQVTAKVDGASDNESGVAYYQYQTASGSESVKDDKWQKYDPEKPPVISGDFCGYVYARAVDAVGNCSSAVASEGFVIDVTPPVIENIKLSEEKVTGSRVIVTFTVKDNYWLETVTVNGTYAGVYVSSFTAFRNDDYLIVACDKVGNRAEQLVQITNINTTPFTLLDTWKSMNAQDFTPVTWAAAEKAANELQTLITVNAPQAQVEASAGQLLTALEGLVTRGDGTLSRELIERVNAYDPSAYTESSWAQVQTGISELEVLLANPESTQEQVDAGRRALEQKVLELVKLADFTDLDRLISQCERMDTDKFSTETYKMFTEALNNAKNLSRTDSGQTAADEAYEQLLAAMGGLEVYEKGGINITPIVYVIMGLLIVTAGTALLIVRLRARKIGAWMEEKLSDEQPEEQDEEPNSVYGDICFTDEEEPAVPKEASDGSDEIIGGADKPTYIGHR